MARLREMGGIGLAGKFVATWVAGFPGSMVFMAIKLRSVLMITQQFAILTE
jgi:hypothetical protein